MKMQMSIGKKKSLLWSNSNLMGLEYTKPKPVFDRNQHRNRYRSSLLIDFQSKKLALTKKYIHFQEFPLTEKKLFLGKQTKEH